MIDPERHPPRLLGAALRVARKELAEGVRDRQTVLYVVVLPLCLYPVLFWLMIQGALLVQGRRQQTQASVALATEAGAEAPAGLEEALARPRGRELEDGAAARGTDATVPEYTERPGFERLEVLPVPPPADPADRGTWRAAPSEETADALLVLGPEERAPPARLYHDSTKSRSELARQRVEERLAAFGEELRAAAVSERGLPEEALSPFTIEERVLDEERELGAYMLSFILPLLLVIATVLGAFVPAVDLTAGEHERGAAETTQLLPVPRLSVHLGKVMAVCASGLVATVLNLFALALSAEHLLGMLGGAARIDLPLRALALMLPFAVLFSFTVSAALCGIASLARSFKEGQALLGPVQMVFILPAMAGVIPGLELTPRLALVPIVNMVLAFKSLIRGQAPALELALVALSLTVLAAVSIWLCVRLLSREATVASSTTFSVRRIFALLASPPAQR